MISPCQVQGDDCLCVTGKGKKKISVQSGGMTVENKIFKVSNLNKTIRYLKKNGIRHAWYAAKERIEEEKRDDYHYVEPSQERLEQQREETADWPYLFSIVVPAYETKEAFLRAMIDSVRRQSYDKWELVIVDASGTNVVEKVTGEILKESCDSRMKYRHVRENKGISGNTNIGIGMAAGDYIALLDHDDFLAPDALYHMACSLRREQQQGRKPLMLYSDEDKYDSSACYYMTPHKKEKFNLDLILSNNYVCHFMAVEANLMKNLQLCGKYDGAQDYELVLRVVDKLYGMVPVQNFTHSIVHVPKVLYHWRCHAESTAGNTASKSYAYEAGKAALEDFCGRRGWDVQVGHSLHLGFYEISYDPDMISVRKEVGIVGGRIVDGHNRICAGAYREDGTCLYRGLHKEYSGGSTHRAVLKQDVYAADIRCVQVCPALQEVYQEITGLPYREKSISFRTGGIKTERRIADISGLHCDEAGYRKLSLELGRAAAEKGYLVVWDPALTVSKGNS